MKMFLPILTLSLAATGLHAQKVEVRGGVLAGLSSPIGDLNNKHNYGTNSMLGINVGGHLDIHFNRHHQLRPHLTYTHMPGSEWSNVGPDFKNKFSTMQLGADWVYSFDHPDRGLYSVLGLSFAQIKREIEVNGFSAGTYTQSGKLALRGGLGYSFSPLFGLEGHVNQAQVTTGGNDGFGFDTATWMQVSAVWRFGK